MNWKTWKLYNLCKSIRVQTAAMANSCVDSYQPFVSHKSCHITDFQKCLDFSKLYPLCSWVRKSCRLTIYMGGLRFTCNRIYNIRGHIARAKAWHIFSGPFALHRKVKNVKNTIMQGLKVRNSLPFVFIVNLYNINS